VAEEILEWGLSAEQRDALARSAASVRDAFDRIESLLV
jgi:hypothetical protein